MKGMAKTDETKTTVLRIEKAVDSSGKSIPGKWNTVELEIVGRISKRVVHEAQKPLAVAREAWRKQMVTRLDVNPEDAQW